jgi:hypothetical protein
MAGDIEAGRAFVKMLVDDKELRAKFDVMQRELSQKAVEVAKVGAAIGGVGLAIAAPFTVAITKFADFGSELFDMKQRTGETVQVLSEMKYVAEQTGTSLGTIEKAILKARQQGKSFDELAAQILAVKNPANQLELAIEKFGLRIGPAILPAIRDMVALREEARNLGVTMDDETAAKADALGDAFGMVKAAVQAVTIAVGSQFSDQLIKLAGIITNSSGVVVQFIKENKNLIIAIGAVGFGLAALGSGLVIFAGALKIASIAVGVFRGALTLLATHPIIAAITIFAAGVAYLTNGFGLLTTEVDDSAQSMKDLETAMSANLGAAKKNNEQLLTNVQDTQTEIIAAERNAFAERKRMEEQFAQRRQEANTSALDKFIADNERKLKEAEELQQQAFAAAFPQRAAAEERQRKAAEDAAELRRRAGLVNSIPQLRQNLAMAHARDIAVELQARVGQGLPLSGDERRQLDRFNRQTQVDPRVFEGKLDGIRDVLTNILEEVSGPFRFPVGKV